MEVVIVSAVRTAVGRMGGTIKDVQPEKLGEVVIRECLKRANFSGDKLDEVIMGHAKQTTDAPNIARVAALYADVPVEVPAYTVHRQCGSGLQAINNAVQAIKSGVSEVVLAGGVESMSNAPYYLRSARFGYGAGNAELVDSNTESQPRSQPIETYGNLTMGLTAENLAEKYDISRDEQDRFAIQSQERAHKAIASGKFEEQTVPVEIKKRKETKVFKVDEHPRATSLEKLAQLRPVFKEGGSVTAGNSSGRNDGAGVVLLMTKEKAQKYGLKPMARVVSQAAAGVRPDIMGIGPVPATKIALKRADLTIDQIDLIELNEAFAAQSLAVIQQLGLNEGITNVNGGAIALGHPLGATGAILMTKLLYEMRDRGCHYGLNTLCIGGGQGIATIVENLMD